MPLNELKPYKWLYEATIYNKNKEKIPVEWLEDKADIIILLFTAYNVDRNGIIEKFYEIYEDAKFLNFPIEVIYIPMDDTEEDSVKAYENQANWFTIKFDDPLVTVLQYMYSVSSIPRLLVMKMDGTIVSSHGIPDLEQYGKNAIITWTSKTASAKKPRKLSKEFMFYGEKWNYMNNMKPEKGNYQRKFKKENEASGKDRKSD